MPDRAAPISAPPYTYIMKTLKPRRTIRQAIMKISLVYMENAKQGTVIPCYRHFSIAVRPLSMGFAKKSYIFVTDYLCDHNHTTILLLIHQFASLFLMKIQKDFGCSGIYRSICRNLYKNRSSSPPQSATLLLPIPAIWIILFKCVRKNKYITLLEMII